MVHERIKLVIKALGIKSKYIAGKLGKSEAWMSSILNGRTKLSAETAQSIAIELGVDVSIFFDQNLFELKMSELKQSDASAQSSRFSNYPVTQF